MKELRKYQQQAITAVSTRLQAGVDKSLMVMSMGLGKTYTAVKLTEQLNFNKVLWVTDNEDLVEQSALAFIADKFDNRFTDHVKDVGFIDYVKNGGMFAGGDFKMGLIKADVFQPNGNITICSAQTLHRRLDRLNPDDYDCVIIDEAHTTGAATYFKGVDYFKPKLRLGLTATPWRESGVMLSDIFDEIVFEYGMRDGIRDGYLAELDGIRIKTNLNLDNIKTVGGEFNQQQLSNEVNNPVRNNLVANSYLEYAKGRQAIGYGVDITHCMDLAEAFQMKGINATAVSSDEERTGDRSQKIKDYKAGKYDVIFNVNLLVKGFDHPNTGCGIMACPTKSKVKYLQSVGRPSRLKDDEYVAKFGQNAIILDVVDVTNKHQLINAWELDKQLPPEERCFLTEIKREKLLAARQMKIQGNLTNKDEKVKLLQITNKRYSNSMRGAELATEKQISFLKALNYPTEGVIYTKRMVEEILDILPATRDDLSKLKEYGFDVSVPINRGNAKYNIWLYEQKQK